MEQQATPGSSAIVVSIEGLGGPIERDEVALYYQPILNLVTEAVVGFEAIALRPYDRLSLIDAGDLVPPAERAGLIRALDWRALTAACDQLGDWQRDVLVGPGFRVSVNISGAALDGGELVERVRTALAMAGASADGLVLELDETNAIESIDAARRSFEGLHAMGVELALDNFGPQRTASTCLDSLPFDIVKLNRDFVRDSNTEIGKAFIRAFVELGRYLGTRLIAEGIETSTQAATLRALGCDSGQGNLWAPPLSAHDAERMLCCPVHDESTSWNPESLS